MNDRDGLSSVVIVLVAVMLLSLLFVLTYGALDDTITALAEYFNGTSTEADQGADEALGDAQDQADEFGPSSSLGLGGLPVPGLGGGWIR